MIALILAELAQQTITASSWVDVVWKLGTVVGFIILLILKTQFVSKNDHDVAITHVNTTLETIKTDMNTIKVDVAVHSERIEK